MPNQYTPSTKVKQICLQCDKEFLSFPCEIKRDKKFCSKSCYNIYKNLSPDNPRFVEHFWGKVDKSGGQDSCWEWQKARHKNGYGKAPIGNGKVDRAHRVAFELAYGPIPARLCVLHKCDNPPCCNLSHLFLGTNKDNRMDSITKGRHAYGERNGKAKITEEQVKAIRNLADAGIMHIVIATKFGISSCHVSDIVKKRRWKYVA